MQASLPDLCPIMRETDDSLLAEQYQHLIDCELCRMICAAIDLHPNQGWNTCFAFDITIEMLQRCLNSKKTDRPNFNNCPLISERYAVNRHGGIFVSQGKASHSTDRIPGTRLVKFRDSAGSRQAGYFLLFKLTSSIKAGKGTFFCNMHLFFNDATELLESLKMFNGNPLPLEHFNKAAKAIQIFCRKCPNNICAEHKPNACELTLYNEIYNNSKLSFCSKCNVECSVNKQLMIFFENIIKLYISLPFTPKTTLKQLFGNDFITKYLSFCTITETHASPKANPNFVVSLTMLQ